MSKVVILAGGKGLRFGEQTKKKPKPLISIGPSPLIWYIMNHYSNYNLKDFIVLAGYKYLNFVKEFKKKKYSNWKIELINTGLNTETGERLLKAKKNILNNNCNRYFFLTYGDGLSNVNINDSLKIFKNTDNFLRLISTSILLTKVNFFKLFCFFFFIYSFIVNIS